MMAQVYIIGGDGAQKAAELVYEVEFCVAGCDLCILCCHLSDRLKCLDQHFQ